MITKIRIERDDEWMGHEDFCNCHFTAWTAERDRAEAAGLADRFPGAEVEVKIHRNTSGFATRITVDTDDGDSFTEQDGYGHYASILDDIREEMNQASLDADLVSFSPAEDCHCGHYAATEIARCENEANAAGDDDYDEITAEDVDERMVWAWVSTAGEAGDFDMVALCNRWLEEKG